MSLGARRNLVATRERMPLRRAREKSLWASWAGNPVSGATDPAYRRKIGGHSTGTTGFDAVDPCERLQVEVPGGLVKNREKPIRADHEFALAA